jgi:hypothetical protein
MITICMSLVDVSLLSEAALLHSTVSEIVQVLQSPIMDLVRFIQFNLKVPEGEATLEESNSKSKPPIVNMRPNDRTNNVLMEAKSAENKRETQARRCDQNNLNSVVS